MPPPAEEPSVMHKHFNLTPDGKWRVEVAARSDVGCVRTNNEDAFGMKGWSDGAPGCLVSLADGMGGAAAGEVASDLAVRTLERVYFEKGRKLHPRESLREALDTANQAILERSSSDQRLGGMGTTCTTLAFAGLDIYVGHVGDSRAYRVDERGITTLTQDHTLAAELEHMVGPGAVAPEGSTNVLTRCLGTKPTVEAEISTEPLRAEKGQTYVLCSDGLSNLVDTEEIRTVAGRHSPEEACQILVDLARERGGPDNITVQVARVHRS
jgi:protein phosphatase